MAGASPYFLLGSRLGHAQTSATMNIYAHALQESDRKAADALENLLSKEAENKKIPLRQPNSSQMAFRDGKRMQGKKKKALKIKALSWSCWADSNRRPHPYQF